MNMRFLYWAAKESGETINFMHNFLFDVGEVIDYKGERVRKDAKYSKQYLEGKYGADPFIQKGVFWDGKNS